MKYLKEKIENSHFPKYFIALKEMIFGVQIEENNNNLKLYLTQDNIDNVNIIVRNLLMMEEEHQKKLIELKFSTTLLNIAKNYFKEQQFEKMIGDDKNISLMNERIISCLNEMNLIIYES